MSMKGRPEYRSGLFAQSRDLETDRDPPVRAAASGVTIEPEARELFASANEFAFRAFDSLASDATVTNPIVSPFTLTYALYLLTNASRGETRRLLSKALGCDRLLLREVNSLLVPSIVATSVSSPEVKCLPVSAIFHDQQVRVQETFASAIRSYGAGLIPLDMSDPSSEQVYERWLKEKSGMSGASFRPDKEAKLLLLSALQFQAPWLVHFDPENTEDADFRCSNGRLRRVPMMHSCSRLLCMEDGHVKGICLPYANPRFAMYVFLHDQGPRVLARELNTQRCRRLREMFAEVEDGVLYIPRWELRSTFDIEPMLKAVGLGDLFLADKADFRGACPDIDMPLFLNRAQQELYVKVDEQGTTANAAYIFTLPVCTGAVEITLDRPFLFVIADELTGSLILLGIIDDPGMGCQ